MRALEYSYELRLLLRQTPEPRGAIVTMEIELRRLRAENAQLKHDLASSRQQLAALHAALKAQQPYARGAGGFPPPRPPAATRGGAEAPRNSLDALWREAVAPAPAPASPPAPPAPAPPSSPIAPDVIAPAAAVAPGDAFGARTVATPAAPPADDAFGARVVATPAAAAALSTDDPFGFGGLFGAAPAAAAAPSSPGGLFGAAPVAAAAAPSSAVAPGGTFALFDAGGGGDDSATEESEDDAPAPAAATPDDGAADAERARRKERRKAKKDKEREKERRREEKRRARRGRGAATPPAAYASGPAWQHAGTAQGGRYGGQGNPAFADAREAPDDDGLAARALGIFGAAKDAVSSYVDGPSGGGGQSYSRY